VLPSHAPLLFGDNRPQRRSERVFANHNCWRMQLSIIWPDQLVKGAAGPTISGPEPPRFKSLQHPYRTTRPPDARFLGIAEAREAEGGSRPRPPFSPHRLPTACGVFIAPSAPVCCWPAVQNGLHTRNIGFISPD
jgi:hypothetical protein